MTDHDEGGMLRTVGGSENRAAPPGKWNRMIVTGRGQHRGGCLNGHKSSDLERDKSAMKDRPLEGYIGLQDHGEPHNLRFRNIWLKEL